LFFRKWWAELFTPQLRILFIDDSVPDQTLGAGAPRAAQILRSLSESGAAVTLFPVSKASSSRRGPCDVKCEHGGSAQSLSDFLKQQHAEFDVIIISRPHNMAFFNEACADWPDIQHSKFIVYDAEAIFASREALHRQIRGNPLLKEQADEAVRQELDLARAANLILAVGDHEARRFREAGYTNVCVLGYAVSPSFTNTPFGRRANFLFVGPTDDQDTPNSDSMVWFADHVLPQLRAVLGEEVVLSLVGKSESQDVIKRKARGIDFRGQLLDLNEIYENARVFVAPTRFAAGVPLKVYGAAAHGVPCVVTSLLARQLGWSHECEVLIADTPQAFAEQCLRLYRDEALWERIRTTAFERVSRDCDVQSFDWVIENIQVLAKARRSRV
jgi:hypothetical protein